MLQLRQLRGQGLVGLGQLRKLLGLPADLAILLRELLRLRRELLRLRGDDGRERLPGDGHVAARRRT